MFAARCNIKFFSLELNLGALAQKWQFFQKKLLIF
jgi:hypothetical protein